MVPSTAERGDHGLGSIQQIVVVSPMTGQRLSQARPGSIGVMPGGRFAQAGERAGVALSSRPSPPTPRGHRSRSRRQRWRRSSRDPDAPEAASGAREAPNRPKDRLVLAPRPRTGTPSLVHSLRNRQAGEQQAPRKIQTKITSRGHTVGKQCLEWPNIVLRYQELTCATSHHNARSAVINRCGQMAAKHDTRVDADRVGIAKLLERLIGAARWLSRACCSSDSDI